MSDLNKYDDNVIIFQAIEKGYGVVAPPVAPVSVGSGPLIIPSVERDGPKEGARSRRSKREQQFSGGPIIHETIEIVDEEQSERPREVTDHSSIETERTTTRRATSLDSDDLEPISKEDFLRIPLQSDPAPMRFMNVLKETVDMLKPLREDIEKVKESISDADSWLTSIAEIEGLFVGQPTMCVLLGNSAVGKSSMIDALIDKAVLRPTWCDQPFPQIPVEISWNKSKSTKYSAEIEYLSLEEWESEVRELQSEIMSEEATSVENPTNLKSYKKLMSVYPSLSKQQLADAPPKSLAKEPSLSSNFGETVHINETSSEEFTNVLHSLACCCRQSKQNSKTEQRERYWPLIKLIRIFVRTSVLEKGTTIIDLPCVDKCSPSSISMMEDYLENCANFILVAPLNTVNGEPIPESKYAKELKEKLRKGFTRADATFVCSRIDEINASEVADTVGLGAEIQGANKRVQTINAEDKVIRKKLKELDQTKEKFQDLRDQKDEELRRLYLDRRKANVCKDSRSKSVPAKKRKAQRPVAGRRKRRAVSSLSSKHTTVIAISSDEDGDEAEEDNTTFSLSISLSETIQAAKTAKMIAEQQLTSIQTERALLHEKIVTNLRKIREIRCPLRKRCLSSVLQLLQSNTKNVMLSQRDTSSTQDPARRMAVATPPLFSISSSAYQHLHGRGKRTIFDVGFENLADTGIPQLRTYLKYIGIPNCRQIVRELDEVTGSLGDFLASGQDTNEGRSKSTMKLHRQFLKNIEEKMGPLREMRDVLAGFVGDLNQQLFRDLKGYRVDLNSIVTASDLGTAVREEWVRR